MTMANILDLPEEVLLKIMVLLSVRDSLRLEATCHRLRSISNRYWRRFRSLDLLAFLNHNGKTALDLSSAYKFDMAAKCVIERVGPNLKHLTLSRFGPLEYGLRMGLEYAVLEHCSQLESLNLSYRLLDRSWFLQMAKATETLKSVDLSQVHIRHHSGLGDEMLASALTHWCHLETLTVRNNKLIQLSCYRSLPKTLKQLDIRGCTVRSTFLNSALQHCPKLDTLLVSYHPDFLFLQPLSSSETGLRNLCIECPAPLAFPQWLISSIETTSSLRSLTICSHLASESLFKLISRCLVHLEQLSLPGSRPAPLDSAEQALLHLVQLPSLAVLRASSNPIGPTLLRLCGQFGRLVEVDVSYAVKERDLANLCSPVLRKLVIKGLYPINCNWMRIRNNLLTHLRPNCPALETLILL